MWPDSDSSAKLNIEVSVKGVVLRAFRTHRVLRPSLSTSRNRPTTRNSLLGKKKRLSALPLNGSVLPSAGGSTYLSERSIITLRD